MTATTRKAQRKGRKKLKRYKIHEDRTRRKEEEYL